MTVYGANKKLMCLGVWKVAFLFLDKEFLDIAMRLNPEAKNVSR